jgi:hypothetical protein
MTQEETEHPLVSLASLTIETFFVRYLSLFSSYRLVCAHVLIVFSVLFFPDICIFLCRLLMKWRTKQ